MRGANLLSATGRALTALSMTGPHWDRRLAKLSRARHQFRRSRRRDLDKVGWMPWNFIQILGFLGAIVAAALALKVG